MERAVNLSEEGKTLRISQSWTRRLRGLLWVGSWSGAICLASSSGHCQSADWQQAIYREPQVRYLMADMCLSGHTELYRSYAGEDPDSREAIRLWDAGVRVVNTNDFERRWITNWVHATKRYLRVVFRGSNRTISGNEVLLTVDQTFQQSAMRTVLADLTLGRAPSFYASRAAEPSVAEALRRWAAGVRMVNGAEFEARGEGEQRRLVYRGTDLVIDGVRVKLNSDPCYAESNARYFLADIVLGGGADFYRRAAEEAHETGCQEAVARWENGVRITNLDQLERKRVNGQMVITRKGSEARISGLEVKLSTD
jgi:hypothetical protein